MSFIIKIPKAPNSIQKGYPLKNVLGPEAIKYLANNISHVYSDFDKNGFTKTAKSKIDELEFMDRARHIAKSLRPYLPERYEDAAKILINSLSPPVVETEGLGLAVLFYTPHSCFIADYGVDKKYNNDVDPFEISMQAQYEITKRSTSEFSIRPFLIQKQRKTLARLKKWTKDPDPHVRRLCTEGTRPRLPWAMRIPAFVDDPTPALPILEKLKDDPSLYVRRSVANHLGDITKDHPELVFEICQRWLEDASKERKWLIRHALRYPANKGNKTALKLRKAAK